jgi:hypothetical protein
MVRLLSSNLPCRGPRSHAGSASGDPSGTKMPLYCMAPSPAEPREGCAGRDRRERCVTQWSTGAKRTPQQPGPPAGAIRQARAGAPIR